MGFLIDGNNLMHTLRKVGVAVDSDGLCEFLSELARRGSSVCVVFDGPARPTRVQAGDLPLQAVYSGRRKADDLILEGIEADTAPRRLTVVSTDRQIRRAARRRRCKTVTSDDFVVTLRRTLYGRPKKRRTEPPEKRNGLGPEQRRAWLKEFGIDQDSPKP